MEPRRLYRSVRDRILFYKNCADLLSYLFEILQAV